ncbi:MAG: RNA polymerase sigma factor [Phycisphaerae bacterium]
MHTTRASLLLRVRDPKDATAWTEFDAIYRPLLVRFGQSNGLGEADVEDVAQHCMTAIHKRIASFDYDPEKGRFKGWLRTLVNNRIRDLHRRRQDEQARTGDFDLWLKPDFCIVVVIL